MRKEFLDYIDDIIDAMDKAQSLIKDITFDQFQDDIRTNYAVVRCLEIIGEAVKNIPDDLRIKYPNIPWKSMAGMRDRLIHGYNNINLELVWNTVNESISSLLNSFTKIKEDYPG